MKVLHYSSRKISLVEDVANDVPTEYEHPPRTYYRYPTKGPAITKFTSRNNMLSAPRSNFGKLPSPGVMNEPLHLKTFPLQLRSTARGWVLL